MHSAPTNPGGEPLEEHAAGLSHEATAASPTAAAQPPVDTASAAEPAPRRAAPAIGLARPAAAPGAFARPVPYAAVEPLAAPLELRYLTRREAALDLSLVLLATIVTHYLPALAVWVQQGGLGPAEFDATVLIAKWSEAVLAAGLAAYLLLRQRIRPASFGLRGDDAPGQIAWALLTFFAMYAVFLAVGAALVALTPEESTLLRRELSRRTEFFRTLPTESSSLTTILLLAAVAVHEELLFRGLLLTYLRRVTGRWWSAVAITSLLFAALHFPQGWLAMVQIAGLALVLCGLFIASRSLLAVMLAHFLFDLCQMQIVRLLPDVQEMLERGGAS